MIRSRIIYPNIIDPYLNQALEESLLDSVSNGNFDLILRFWTSSPSVIIGRNQSLKAEVNLKACQKYKVPIIRRITGGGAVYLDLGCLNFSFFLNNKSKHFSKDVKTQNRFFLRIIMNALNENNFDCCISPPNSIFINGKKISGNAQLFKGNSVLHHGTILVNTNLKLLKTLLKTNNYSKGGRYISSKKADTINLFNINKKITMNKIIQTIVKQTKSAFQLRIPEIPLTRNELNQAASLKKEKYSNSIWKKRYP